MEPREVSVRLARSETLDSFALQNLSSMDRKCRRSLSDTKTSGTTAPWPYQ